MSLRNVRIVLVRPQGAANVGAVARAMKNMGLDDLVVVRPRFTSGYWSKIMAVHAGDVLQRMRRYDSLPEAVADCGLVVGTTCRDGLYRAAAEPPRVVAPRLVTAAAQQPAALVFGPEDHGMNNDDLKACHQLVQIPTDTAYPSLNLAQAVMVCCYELCLAYGASVGAEAPPAELATAERVDLLFKRLRDAFLAIGYLHDSNPEHILFAFRRFLGRAQLEDRDVRILLAMARQIEWYGKGGWKVMAERTVESSPAPPSVDEEVAV
ncbi:MAG: RNA methyltransferase [Deltaproteobacteria bacterium]|nr:RNA methyltransferase [Deltaproteobacteria bacterium]